MKKFSKFLVIGLCAIATLASCSKEKEPVNPMIEQMNGQYSESNQEKQLSLLYNGEAMPGKIASIASVDGETITITLKGAELMGMMNDIPGPGSMLPIFGVIPGEKETVLVAAIEENADKSAFTFKGEDKNAQREIVYDGTINDKQMSLNLNVSMNNKLAGTTWNLAPWISDGFTISSQPIHFKWETTGKIYLWAGAEFTPGDLFTLVSGLPLFDGKTLQEMFCNVLKSVTFEKDGNIVAEYSEAANVKEPVWKKSGKNMVMYTADDHQILVEPNIMNIMNELNKTPESKEGEPALNLDMLINGMMKMLPLVSNGLPLIYTETENGMTVILDTRLTKALLDAVIPFLKDEVNHAIIVTSLSEMVKEANLQLLLNDIPKTVDTMIASLEQTTKIELGINLTK